MRDADKRSSSAAARAREFMIGLRRIVSASYSITWPLSGLRSVARSNLSLKKKRPSQNAADALSTLEVDSNRRLHHSWGTRAGDGAETTRRSESCVSGLPDNRCAGVASGSTCKARIWINLSNAESDTPVDISEIGMIEEIVSFPTQLN